MDVYNISGNTHIRIYKYEKVTRPAFPKPTSNDSRFISCTIDFNGRWFNVFKVMFDIYKTSIGLVILTVHTIIENKLIECYLLSY